MSLDGRRLLRTLGPGMLVAATGVGAGDLITASLAGSDVGLIVVWGALLGAALKWGLNEGIVRWQLGSGTTLLEGWHGRLGSWFSWLFMLYFLAWTFGVGGALVSAAGIAGTALLPIGDAETSKIVWGIIHSIAGGLLVWRGGFARFEQAMTLCIALMFTAVIVTAGLLVLGEPDGFITGLFAPRMPSGAEDWRWFLAVLGGVGGTVTMLSYGYWIREAGRRGVDGLKSSRIDLAVSYTLTGLFGAAMVVIGTRIENTGTGARVALQLADQLGSVIDPALRWLFLIGFWAAIFSSLLGVWQSAPYLFTDFYSIMRGHAVERKHPAELRRSSPYRWYLLAITLFPLVWLWTPIKQIQLIYATLGAWFMPVLALTLLVMNNRRSWVPVGFRNGLVINALLVITLILFVYMAWAGIGE